LPHVFFLISFLAPTAKTDKADAKLIADYGAKFEEKSYEKLSPEAKQLRDLYRCSAALKEQIVQCKTHIEGAQNATECVKTVWATQLLALEKVVVEKK
jgi:transposase